MLLDDRDRRAVYLSEGLGHGFCSLEDGSTVVYLCSEGYNPTGEHEVHPLDPAIGIEWPLDGVEPELSAKDAAAPTLAEAAAAGLLPDWRHAWPTARRMRREGEPPDRATVRESEPRASGPGLLDLHLPDAMAPAEIEVSTDPRTLGFGLTGMDVRLTGPIRSADA